MAALPCRACGGERWVRYLSETIEGEYEEAFRLCECNYELQERRHSEPRQRLDRAEITLMAGRLRLVAHGVMFEVSLDPGPSAQATTTR